MWNKSISLPIKKKETQDGAGFSDAKYEFLRGIPADFTDVTRNDEILAAQKGYTINQNVEIMACNYSGQRWLIDETDGQIFDIKRTYRKSKGMRLVLSCERRETNGI